jgi:hypothetical protein
MAFGLYTDEALMQFALSLISANWETNEGPLFLRDDLTLAQLAGSRFFTESRLFLRLLHEDKGAQLTLQGNLTRESVASLAGRMPWSREHVSQLNRMRTKVVNELDVFPLHIIRTVSGFGGLVTRRRNRLTASRKAVELSADDQAGRLFRYLFVTFFRQLNLDDLSPFRDVPGVQDTIPLILWALQMAASHWNSETDLARAVLLPELRQRADAVSPLPDTSASILDNEVFQPLVWFGLMECNISNHEWFKTGETRKFRKTPLFDQFLSFSPLP